MDLLKSALEINNERITKVSDIISKVKVDVRKILILGLSFKGGTDDIRGSRGIELANILSSSGYDVYVYDPVAMNKSKVYLDLKIKIINNPDKALGSMDAIVIATDWSEFEEMMLHNIDKIKKGTIIIDGRRLLINHKNEFLKHGIKYYALGTYRSE